MVCVNQTRPHCVNQMGKTQSKPLAERHGRGTAVKRQENERGRQGNRMGTTWYVSILYGRTEYIKWEIHNLNP
jgi:hypothetical protein